MRYNKDIIVVETDHPFTSDENNGFENTFCFQITRGHSRNTKRKIENIGRYNGHRSRCAEQALADYESHALPAMSLFQPTITYV